MIEIETRKFVRAVDIAGSVVERRSPIPVLRQMHVHANGSLAISATDLDMGCEVKLPYTGAPQSPFMLPEPDRLRKAMAHAGGGQILLAPQDSGAVDVATGDFRLAVKGVPPEDFPLDVMNGFGRDVLTCVLGGSELDAIARVSRGMSSEETRYYLNGIYLHAIDDWTLRAVATDGHRLFWANLKVPGAVMDAFTGVILPRALITRTLKRFARCDEVAFVIGYPAPANAPSAAEGTAPAPVGYPRVAMAAAVGDLQVTFRSKTIDGTFPDYARVIPKTHDHRAVVEVAVLRRALQALVVTGSDELPGVKIERDGESLICSVAAHWGCDDSRATVRVPLLDSAGLPGGWNIGFRGRYLLDCLDSCRGERVTFGLSGSNDPVTIVDEADPVDFGMVLMPLRV
jgi:DNA polymerase-3 subunit beta